MSNGKLYVVTKNNFTKQIEIYNVLGKKIVSETLSGKELIYPKLNQAFTLLRLLKMLLAPLES